MAPPFKRSSSDGGSKALPEVDYEGYVRRALKTLRRGDFYMDSGLDEKILLVPEPGVAMPKRGKKHQPFNKFLRTVATIISRENELEGLTKKKAQGLFADALFEEPKRWWQICVDEQEARWAKAKQAGDDPKKDKPKAIEGDRDAPPPANLDAAAIPKKEKASEASSARDMQIPKKEKVKQREPTSENLKEIDPVKNSEETRDEDDSVPAPVKKKKKKPKKSSVEPQDDDFQEDNSQLDAVNKEKNADNYFEGKYPDSIKQEAVGDDYEAMGETPPKMKKKKKKRDMGDNEAMGDEASVPRKKKNKAKRQDLDSANGIESQDAMEMIGSDDLILEGDGQVDDGTRKKKKKKGKKKRKKLDDGYDDVGEAEFEDEPLPKKPKKRKGDAEARTEGDAEDDISDGKEREDDDVAPAKVSRRKDSERYRAAKAAFEKEKAEIMSNVPDEVKSRFGMVCFGDWKPKPLPVLVMDPFSAPPGPGRDTWLEMYGKVKKANRLHKLTYLGYWYGAPKHPIFSMLTANKLIPLSEGNKKGLFKLTPAQEKKVEAGEITPDIEAHLRVAREMEADLKKDPSERRGFIPDFLEEYDYSDAEDPVIEEVKEMKREPKKHKKRLSRKGKAKKYNVEDKFKAHSNKGEFDIDSSSKEEFKSEPMSEMEPDGEHELKKEPEPKSEKEFMSLQKSEPVPKKEFPSKQDLKSEPEPESPTKQQKPKFSDDDSPAPTALKGDKERSEADPKQAPETPAPEDDNSGKNDSAKPKIKGQSPKDSTLKPEKSFISKAPGLKRIDSDSVGSGDYPSEDGPDEDASIPLDSDEADDDFQFDMDAEPMAGSSKKGTAKSKTTKEKAKKGEAGKPSKNTPAGKQKAHSKKAGKLSLSNKAAAQKEMKAFEKCERRFGDVVSEWEIALSDKNAAAIIGIMQKISNHVEDLSVPFIEVYELPRLLKRTKKIVDSPDRSDLWSRLKARYNNLKDQLPKGFKTPRRSSGNVRPKDGDEAKSSSVSHVPKKATSSKADGPKESIAKSSGETKKEAANSSASIPLKSGAAAKKKAEAQAEAKVQVAEKPSPAPKPQERKKKFSLGTLMRPTKEPKVAANKVASEKVVQRGKAPQQYVLPPWVTTLPDDAGKLEDVHRRLAAEFLQQAVRAIPTTNGANREAVALAIESAIYASSKHDSQGDAYWDSVHNLSASIHGSGPDKQAGTLAVMIGQGRVASPGILVKLPREKLSASFNHRPVDI